MGTVRWHAALMTAAIVLRSAGWASAGHVLFDAGDRQMLEASDPDAVTTPGRVADILLLAVLRERLASGELSLTERVTVLPVAGDRGPHLSTHEPVEIGELLQLLLLSDSRTAAKTLAWAAGPSIGRCLARMQQVVVRLDLSHTTLADDWPFAPTTSGTKVTGRRGSTTARELGRAALAITSDPDLRRRLALDGVPISNGGLIVRATDPLIAIYTDRPPAAADDGSPEPGIGLATRDGLELLAVTTGRSNEELRSLLDRGFQRYRRVQLVQEGQSVGPMVRVRGGIIPTFNAIAGEPWAMTTRADVVPDLAFRLQLPTEIAAPVDVRQPLGELVVEQNGRLLGVVPLVAPQAIAPSGWLDTAHRGTLP